MNIKISKNYFSAIALATSIFIHSAAAKPNDIIPTNHTSQQTGRIVYGSGMSPFVFKVLVALREKGLDFNHVETLPLSVSKHNKTEPLPEFVKASPLGKIPAYQEGDWTIADSSVIIAYLDRQYSQPQLYPADAKKYAETLWFQQYGDEVLAGVIHQKILVEKVVKPKLFGKPTDQAVLEKAINTDLPPLLAYLEKTLEGRTWVIGDQFTAADIAIGTHLLTLKKCEIELKADKWPNLVRYIKQLQDRPSFQPKQS